MLEGHDYDIYKNNISRLLGVNMGVLDKWKKKRTSCKRPGHDYDMYKNYISRLLGVNMGVLDK